MGTVVIQLQGGVALFYFVCKVLVPCNIFVFQVFWVCLFRLIWVSFDIDFYFLCGSRFFLYLSGFGLWAFECCGQRLEVSDRKGWSIDLGIDFYFLWGSSFFD